MYKIYFKAGYRDLSKIKSHYNSFATGGDLDDETQKRYNSQPADNTRMVAKPLPSLEDREAIEKRKYFDRFMESYNRSYIRPNKKGAIEQGMSPSEAMRVYGADNFINRAMANPKVDQAVGNISEAADVSMMVTGVGELGYLGLKGLQQVGRQGIKRVAQKSPRFISLAPENRPLTRGEFNRLLPEYQGGSRGRLSEVYYPDYPERRFTGDPFLRSPEYIEYKNLPLQQNYLPEKDFKTVQDLVGTSAYTNPSSSYYRPQAADRLQSIVVGNQGGKGQMVRRFELVKDHNKVGADT